VCIRDTGDCVSVRRKYDKSVDRRFPVKFPKFVVHRYFTDSRSAFVLRIEVFQFIDVADKAI
jgi:hypothetical protein